jgi:hypothetical protein
MRIHGSHDPLTRTLTSGLLGFTLMGAMAAGCSSTSPIVHSASATAPTGSVRLEEVADWEFEAAHPSALEAVTIDSLLRAVTISDTPLDRSNLPVDGSKPMRAFSDEDVRFLAPLLAQALSQARPEYVVAFHLSSSAGSSSEPTAGTLYIRNDRLYLTLSEHQGPLEKIEASWFGGGRPARVVTIVPESAGQIEPALPSIAHGRQGLKSLAIDYKEFLFAKQPEPGPRVTAATAVPSSQPIQQLTPSRVLVAAVTDEQPSQNPSMMPQPGMDKPAMQASPPEDDRLSQTLQELEDARRVMARKDAKISALRRDLESMRTQLETRDKELRAVKSTRQTQSKPDKRHSAELTIR